MTAKLNKGFNKSNLVFAGTDKRQDGFVDYYFVSVEFQQSVFYEEIHKKCYFRQWNTVSL